MDRAKFEQMVELFNEGKSSDVISKAIRASSAIVDWFLLFIKLPMVSKLLAYFFMELAALHTLKNSYLASTTLS